MKWNEKSQARVYALKPKAEQGRRQRKVAGYRVMRSWIL